MSSRQKLWDNLRLAASDPALVREELQKGSPAGRVCALYRLVIAWEFGHGADHSRWVFDLGCEDDPRLIEKWPDSYGSILANPEACRKRLMHRISARNEYNSTYERRIEAIEEEAASLGLNANVLV